MKISPYLIALLVLLTFTGSAASMSKPSPADSIRSGMWLSGTGNYYAIRKVDHEIFWLGMNKPDSATAAGKQWCHVGHGIVKGGLIYLDWADIPVGSDNLHGKIIIKILSPSHLKIINDGGIFGLSDFYWKWEHMNL